MGEVPLYGLVFRAPPVLPFGIGHAKSWRLRVYGVGFRVESTPIATSRDW